MTNLDLHDWHLQVHHHLDMIDASTQMCARHVRQLVGKPEFQTLAEDELASVKSILERALAKVTQAQAEYNAKEIVR